MVQEYPRESRFPYRNYGLVNTDTKLQNEDLAAQRKAEDADRLARQEQAQAAARELLAKIDEEAAATALSLLNPIQHGIGLLSAGATKSPGLAKPPKSQEE